jgi:hypothetical protein
VPGKIFPCNEAICCHCAQPIPATICCPALGNSNFYCAEAICCNCAQPFVAPLWGIPIFIALRPFAAIMPRQSRPPFDALHRGHSHMLITPRPFDASCRGILICLLHQGHLMPRAGAFPFDYRIKAIQCLTRGHSHLLIVPRPFDASRGGIPICLLHQGHSLPCAGTFPHTYICLSCQGHLMLCAGAFPFAYCAKAIRCLAWGHSHLLIAPRPFDASRGGIPICLLLKR